MFNGKTHYKCPFSMAMLVITGGYWMALSSNPSLDAEQVELGRNPALPWMVEPLKIIG